MDSLGGHSKDGGAPNSAQTSFIAKISGVEVGAGTLTYSLAGSEWTVWYYFDEWDITGYSGATVVDITYDHGEFYNFRPGGCCAVSGMSQDYHVSCINAAMGGPYLQNSIDYRVQYGGYWKNIVYVDALGDGVNNLDIKRVINGSVYKSSWNVTTADNVYLYDMDGVQNQSFMVFEEPVFFWCEDVFGNLYTDVHGEASYESSVYGYVFDAADNFGIEDAFVEFQSKNVTTSTMGLYSFDSDTFGEVWLNVSKTGYQNSTCFVDYVGSLNLNVYLIKNETMNPGTCTVAGMVYGADLFPVNDVLVRVYNDTWSTYVYTSEEGYFVFYDLTNTTYSLSAEHGDYVKQQKDINLTALDTAYYFTFTLLEEGVIPGVTPTPSPTPPVSMIDPINDVWDMLGLTAWKGLIYSMFVIGGLGLVLGRVGRSPLIGGVGCFFGFILSVAFGWIPVWVVALALVGSAILIAKLAMGGDRG